jgi:hypothetical protein
VIRLTRRSSRCSIEALPALLRGIQPRADAQLLEAAGIEPVSRCPALRHLKRGRLTYVTRRARSSRTPGHPAHGVSRSGRHRGKRGSAGTGFAESAAQAPRGHAAQTQGSSGKIVIQKLTERVANLGIETHFNTRVDV